MTEATPKLRFPEFSGEWRSARAGDAFAKGKARGEAALPIYSVTMDRGLVPRDSLDRHMADDAEDGANLRAEPGDIVYNMMRMWQGAVGVADTACMVSPAYVVLKPKKQTSSAFFNHWFENKRMLYLLGAYSHGLTSDRLRLYYDDFAQIPLHLPSLAEQQKIAGFLGGVDGKLEGLRRKEAGLKRFKAGMMQKLFNQELRFTRDDGSDFPDWDYVAFSAAFDRVRRRNEVGEQNVLTISAQYGLVSQTEFFNKSVAGADLSGYYLLRKGDFAYNKSYSNGYPMGAIKRLNRYEQGVVSSLYICFAAKDEGSAIFFEQYFESGLMNSEIGMIAQEGARNHGLLNVSVSDFFELISVPLPHPDEQRKIADALSALDAKIAAVRNQITGMETFKKGLLQQMFV